MGFVSRWRPWLLLAVCLGALGVYLAVNLAREHAKIAAQEQERLTTQSKVVEDNLTRQFVAINLSLQSVRAELPGWQGRPGGRTEGVQHLKSLETAMPAVRTFLVLDAMGKSTLSNRAELIDRNFYQRDYFQAPLQSLDPDMLFVSPPFKTVMNNVVINLSRVVLDSQGRFAGVVTAAVDPVDIETLLNSVRYADDMRSTLVHGDGTTFVSQPALGEVIGKNMSIPGSPFRQHLESGQAVSHFEGIAQSTGDQRFMVFRTIQPIGVAMDKPLVVSLSRASRALFAHWEADVRNQLIVFVLLALLSSLALWFYRRQRQQQRVSQQRLKLATEAAGVGIWEFDLKSRRYHWDKAMFALFGLDPRQVNERNDDWHQLLLPGELERIKAATRAVLKRREVFNLTFQVRRQDGEVRFMRNRATLHRDERGAPSRLIGTTEDVTERKLREADLRIAAAAFECQESIMVTDANQTILRVNEAFSDLFGYSAQDAVGMTPRILKSGRHDPAHYAAMWAGISRSGAWQGEIWDRRKNGENFPVWLSITAVTGEDGGVTHYVATHTDITLRKAAEEEIKQLAYYDPLTGLPNRRLLQDRLRQAMNHARRNKKHLALLFVDLDRFKPVNDAFGHGAGDELLQAVAQRLQTCVRESDTVARVGGDEFVVLLAVIESVIDASAVARKIHAALIEPLTLSQGQSVTISSSTGIAIYPEHGSDEAELTQHADAAMYQAKAAGRGRFVVYAPQSAPANSPAGAQAGTAEAPKGPP